ncbi:MAG: bifunctional aspartate kinase/homoserine dehydrogenase I [FCB group bacterium]|nr:bifunctional aspartate kinase/homoserine dehydrogenase I [FCB group bacterium]
MKVLKFGGSSIKTPERIRNVLQIIRTSLDETDARAVVVSAFGGVTDQLINLSTEAAKGNSAYTVQLEELSQRHRACVRELIPTAHREEVLNTVNRWMQELEDIVQGVYLVREVTSRTRDLVLSFGERLSAFIISKSLSASGTEAEYLDAREVIITDSRFGLAQVDLKTSYLNIRERFKNGSALRIVTGFIGSTREGETTTLGRSGSDYTASLVGAALEVDEIEIWTDVDGVLTADPRIVSDAFPIESMTYEEAMEMSHFGAKVIFPPTLQPAMKKKIPIRIRNTFHPDSPGTLIAHQLAKTNRAVTGISSIEQIAFLRVQGSGMIGVAGISGRLFQALAQNDINIILITQGSSEHSICFAVEPHAAAKAREVIEEEFELEMKTGVIDKVLVETDLSILAVVGENMRHTPGIAGKVFNCLGKHGVNVIAIAQGSSERNISIIVAKKDESRAIQLLHDTFFRPGKKTLYVYVVGPGLVGRELLSQMEALPGDRITLVLRGVANSKKMVLDPNGIPFTEWQDRLRNSPAVMDLRTFVKEMISGKDGYTVFVDCTASDAVAAQYPRVLSGGISVVTPNKIANTQSWDSFRKLQTLAGNNSVSFLYETNVGAGLPIIRTLRNLVECGDEILRIEAILSGTLSYVFNTIDASTSFSKVIRMAMEKGYTEPDPRDDLSGQDAARKILILVRELGIPLEMEDIAVEKLVPDEVADAASVEDFLAKLETTDADWEAKRLKAEKEGKALRYLAKYENGVAALTLEAVDNRHPFYSLTDNENIVAFTTARYREHPLVIRGPGAGASVTAAGVLADILQTINR